KPLPGGALSPGNKNAIEDPQAKALASKKTMLSQPALSAGRSFCRSAAGATTSCSSVPNLSKLRQTALTMAKPVAARLQYSCNPDSCVCKGLADCQRLADAKVCGSSWYCVQTSWGLICSCS